MFEAIGRGLRLIVTALLWPFRHIGGWFAGRGGVVKIVLSVVLLLLFLLYGYFFWTTQRWTNFNPDYAAKYERTARPGTVAQTTAPGGGIVTTPEEAEGAAGGAAGA